MAGTETRFLYLLSLQKKIDGLTEAFPGKGNYHLADQLRRASISK
jgi:hypothetical protein